VAFAVAATTLIPNNGNTFAYNGGQSPYNDVYVRDTCNAAPAGCTPSTQRVSVAFDGSEANHAGSGQPALSADGRFVGFASLATNLVPADTNQPNAAEDVFIRDTCAGAGAGCTPTTVRVSVALDSGQPLGLRQSNGLSVKPGMSADGHYIAFVSDATNLVTGATSGHALIYLATTGF
jgi:hypothetical protein